MNQFTSIQNRLRALLLAHPVLKDLEIITEEVGNIEAEVKRKIIDAQGLGILIRGSGGSNDETPGTQLVIRDMIAIGIIHSPLLKPAINSLDLQEAVIYALHGKSASVDPVPSRLTRDDKIRFHSWELQPEVVGGIVVRHVIIIVPNRFERISVRDPQV